jgi:hypothetical protein
MCYFFLGFLSHFRLSRYLAGQSSDNKGCRCFVWSYQQISSLVGEDGLLWKAFRWMPQLSEEEDSGRCSL